MVTQKKKVDMLNKQETLTFVLNNLPYFTVNVTTQGRKNYLMLVAASPNHLVDLPTTVFDFTTSN